MSRTLYGLNLPTMIVKANPKEVVIVLSAI